MNKWFNKRLKIKKTKTNWSSIYWKNNQQVLKNEVSVAALRTIDPKLPRCYFATNYNNQKISVNLLC